MADEQIVTSIVAKADLSSLVSEVHRATASLQKLQQDLASAGKVVSSQVKVINNSFGETLRSTGQFATHFVTLHSDVEKFGKGLDSGRLKLRDYFSTFQQHAKTSGGLIRDLAKQQVMLQNAVMQPIGRNAQGLMQYNVHIPRGLDLVKNKTNLARMELQIMNRAINEGATALINWGKNTQWAGRQLTVGLTVPIAAFGAAAAKAFREADQELTRLTKVYGDIGGATAEELTKIRREITATSKELSTSMGVNFKETISLAADIAATGKTGNELIGSLQETTRLAVLGEVDRQEAMKATLAIQSAFKQNTEELAKSINFLNAVENQTSTTLNDLVEAIPKAGPVIKGLGGSVQDLALYLTAMREGGINASEGANALKSALASLINPTDVAVAKFEGFGIDLLGIVNSNAGNVTATLMSLQSALDRLDPLQKQQAIEQLFGKFQFSRLNALFENLGKQGSQTLQVLDLMKASASELEAVASRELSAVTESASGQYKRAIEGLKAELSVLGEDFLEIGTKFLNIVTKLLKFLNNLPEPVKKLVTAFGGLTAVAGPLIMLTGVLANFAGYILKGATNLKSLFSGSKGWKMLTPEIVAANHAARTLEETFYSDAQAAAVLEQALRNLVDEFTLLNNAATKGNISVKPAITTLGSSLIMPGSSTYRPVDPNNPYVGEPETRAMSHINPRKSGFAGNLFGVVPGPIPLNRKIGATPQIYMTERLPDIEGLTSVGGASTGIVAQEAAKFHAMMAALGMQTEAEVAELKKVISLGGTVSSDLLNTYDDLLPITSSLANKAAAESALIVAELRAAKITVEEAKLRILTLNAQIEAQMSSEVASFAALRGRTIDVTKAPLMDQPIVDSAGNYTLRDLYKKEANAQVIREFGRLRGIRSWGGSYGIETTRLPKFNQGGSVYRSPYIVPGPDVNADVVPAMLTPGEFVVNREATRRNLPLLRAINEGTRRGPKLNRGGQPSDLDELYSKIHNVQNRMVNSKDWQAELKLRTIMHDAGILNSYVGYPEEEAIRIATEYFENSWDASYNKSTGLLDMRSWMSERISRGESIEKRIRRLGLRSLKKYKGQGQTERFRPTSSLIGTLRDRVNSGNIAGVSTVDIFDDMIEKLYPQGFNIEQGRDRYLPVSEHHIRENLWRSTKGTYDPKGRKHQLAGNFGMAMMGEDSLNSLTAQIHSRTGGARPDQIIMTNAALMSDIRQQSKRGVNFSNPTADRFTREWLAAAMMRRLPGSAFFMPNASRFSYRNSGGVIPGYNSGGMIPGYNGGELVTRAGMLSKLGAKFKYEGKSYEGHDALQVYRIKAVDINGGRKYFGHIEGLSDKAKGALYNSTLEFFNTSMIKGDKIDGQRMFTPRHLLTAMPTIASNAIVWNKQWLSPEDLAILQQIGGKGGTLAGSVGSSMHLKSVYGDVFMANKGGLVPGYDVGDVVEDMGYTVVDKRAIQGSRGIGGTPLISSSPSASRNPGFYRQQFMTGLRGKGNVGKPVDPMRMMMSQQGIMMGGSMAGMALMGTNPMLGTGVMALSTILPMMGPGIKNFASGLKNAETRSAFLGKALLNVGKILRFSGWAAAIGVAIFAFNKWRQSVAESRREVTLLNGMTVEGAKQAGIKYKDLSKSITEITDKIKAQRALGRAAYDAMTPGGVPGISMTVKDMKDAKKFAKENLQEFVKTFNTISDDQVIPLAQNIKAQFIAGGMSAEEATKKIYGIVAASEKANQALNVLGSAGFTLIYDKASAAEFMVKNLVKNLGEYTRSEDLGNAFSNTLSVIDGIRKGLEGTKDATGNVITETEALKQTLEQIEKINGSDKAIGDYKLNQLKQSQPELASILNSADTIAGVYAKWQVAISGARVNLQNMTSEQAIMLAKFDAAMSTAMENAAKVGGKDSTLGRVGGKLKELDKIAKSVSANAQKNAEASRKKIEEEIKLIDKKIQKINEEADAKIKALQKIEQRENYQLNIQRAQIEYQDAIARGDMAAAARAQLSIEQLTKEQQTALAIEAIEEERERKTKKANKEKEALQEGLNKKQEAFQNQQSNAAEAATVRAELAKQQDAYEDLLKELAYAESMPQKTAKQVAKRNEALKDVAGQLSVFANTVSELATSGSKMQKDAFKEAFGDLIKDGGAKVFQSLAGVVGGKPEYSTTTKFGDTVKEDLKKVERDALAITGGKKLSDLYDLINNKGINGKGGGGGGGTMSNPLQPNLTPEQIAKIKKTEKGFLDQDSKKTILLNLMNQNKDLGPGQFFEYDGVTYKIKGTGTRKTNKSGTYIDVAGFDIAAVTKKYDGGAISGPGTSTSDSIPAYLSNGEYVVRADAVKHYGVETFDALNAKRFKDGGQVNPTMGTPDPTQSFLNKFLFGTRYVGGNMKMLKGEVPLGPGNAAKLFHGTHKLLKAGDIISPSGRTLYTASTGKHIYAGTDVDTAAFWGKKAAEKIGEKIGNRFRSYVYEIEPIGKTIIDQMTPDAMMIEGAAKIIRMVKKARSNSSLGFAGGGYVNPSYTSHMSLPSFGSGVNNLYSDTIAQLHKNEAVIPAEFNPWNPTASNPISPTNNISYNIDVSLNGTNLTPEDVARAIHREMKIRDAASGIGRRI